MQRLSDVMSNVNLTLHRRLVPAGKVLLLYELELLFIAMSLTSSYFRLKPLVSLVQLTELFILTFYGKQKMDVTWSREQILIANVSLSYSV